MEATLGLSTRRPVRERNGKPDRSRRLSGYRQGFSPYPSVVDDSLRNAGAEAGSPDQERATAKRRRIVSRQVDRQRAVGNHRCRACLRLAGGQTAPGPYSVEQVGAASELRRLQPAHPVARQRHLGQRHRRTEALRPQESRTDRLHEAVHAALDSPGLWRGRHQYPGLQRRHRAVPRTGYPKGPGKAEGDGGQARPSPGRRVRSSSRTTATSFCPCPIIGNAWIRSRRRSRISSTRWRKFAPTGSCATT